MNLIESVKKSQEKGLELMKIKNADYSGIVNRFKNFDIAGDICNISSEKGILVRMADKIIRVGNLLDTDAQVKDETIEDTLIDLSNYSLILLAKLKQKKEKNNKLI